MHVLKQCTSIRRGYFFCFRAKKLRQQCVFPVLNYLNQAVSNNKDRQAVELNNLISYRYFGDSNKNELLYFATLLMTSLLSADCAKSINAFYLSVHVPAFISKNKTCLFKTHHTVSVSLCRFKNCQIVCTKSVK